MAEPHEYAPPEEWRSLDLILAQVERILALQLEVSDSYDRKLELLLGFIGVIFAAAFRFDSGQIKWPQVEAFPLVAALGILILTALTSVWAYVPRTLSRPPEP